MLRQIREYGLDCQAELEQLRQKEITEGTKLIKLIVEEETKAEDGDVDAMFRCHQLYANLEMSKHPEQLNYDDDSINWLKKAADHGHKSAVATLAMIWSTGEIPKVVRVNVAISKSKAFEVCSKFTQEDQNKPEIKAFIETLRKEAEEEKKQSGGCYIATAVYGGYDKPEVLALRKFRDEVLLKHLWGRLFVKFYYAVSPPLADKLKKYQRLNHKIKRILDHFVARLENL